jgi:hypothetical protein
MSQSSQKSEARRSFLERPIAIVSLVAGLIGIATGAIALFGGDDSGEDGGKSRIDTCIVDHGLAKSVEGTEVVKGRFLFRACEWPPPPGSGSDGFTEITVSRIDGPGESEAEGMTFADVFTTSCTDLKIEYLFNNMGTFVREQPVFLSKGEVRRVEGGSIWFPRTELEASIYTPGRDEAIVLSAARYSLDVARCVD